MFYGQNMLGTSISAPLIITTNIKKSSYIDVCSPTIKSVNVNQKQSQYGCDVIVDKVEFASDETRVYVTVTNNSNYNFNVYMYSAKLTQNGKQYEYESNYDADYEEIQTEILPGITTSGIITFPSINQSSFNFILDGSSDNWYTDINPYNFAISF